MDSGATPGTTSVANPDRGEKFDGTWNVIELDVPTRLVVEEAIVEDDGTPSDANSMGRMEIHFEAAGDTTPMILTTHCDSLEGALDRRVSGWGDAAPS
jgi:hypothetical protein